jgi:hypothetical protein
MMMRVRKQAGCAEIWTGALTVVNPMNCLECQRDTPGNVRAGLSLAEQG